MKPIRVLEAQTRVDIFVITIHENPDGSFYGEFKGTKPPFLGLQRVGSPLHLAGDRERTIAQLITDCINKVISMAGPIVHMENLGT
jgi:hypothetical protein